VHDGLPVGGRGRGSGLRAGAIARADQRWVLDDAALRGGADEPGEQWWFDVDGHLIASRHCQSDGPVDACVHYGPDLSCTAEPG